MGAGEQTHLGLHGDVPRLSPRGGLQPCVDQPAHVQHQLVGDHHPRVVAHPARRLRGRGRQLVGPLVGRHGRRQRGRGRRAEERARGRGRARVVAATLVRRRGQSLGEGEGEGEGESNECGLSCSIRFSSSAALARFVAATTWPCPHDHKSAWSTALPLPLAMPLSLPLPLTLPLPFRWAASALRLHWDAGLRLGCVPKKNPDQTFSCDWRLIHDQRFPINALGSKHDHPPRQTAQKMAMKWRPFQVAPCMLQ